MTDLSTDEPPTQKLWRRSASMVGEYLLTTWAVLQAAAAAAWILAALNSNPLFTFLNFLEEHGLGHLESALVPGLRTGPIFRAPLENGPLHDDYRRALETFHADQPTSFEVAPDASHLEINLGWSIQAFDMTFLQEAAWTVLQVVPLLLLAVFWWQLAQILRRSRTATPFTVRNARTLTAAGATLAIGAPLLDIALWQFNVWTVSTSQLADEIALQPWGIEQLPLTPIACGIALIAVGQVWRRGVSLEDDVRGLV